MAHKLSFAVAAFVAAAPAWAHHSFAAQFDQNKVVHNTFLQLQTEVGAIGLAAFLLVVGAAVVGSFCPISRMRGVPLEVERDGSRCR